jgi:Glycosyl transferase family 2
MQLRRDEPDDQGTSLIRERGYSTLEGALQRRYGINAGLGLKNDFRCSVSLIMIFRRQNALPIKFKGERQRMAVTDLKDIESQTRTRVDLQNRAPRVSVIMATYNGDRFVRQGINSILAQTLQDFELIITDDCSTDETGAILDSIGDPRVRVLRNSENVGVVQSRNRCLAAARGQYVAMLDHDDLSRPTRLAKQVAYLEKHPGTVLLGTAAHTLNNGALAPTRHPRHTSPAIINWLLYVSNPLVCSSIMFRADAVRQLGVFLREEYRYADDYDLYHRLMPLGDIARLDEPLTIYRLHASNAFRLHEDTMTANAVKVLTPAYRPWFGLEAEKAVKGVRTPERSLRCQSRDERSGPDGYNDLCRRVVAADAARNDKRRRSNPREKSAQFSIRAPAPNQ